MKRPITISWKRPAILRLRLRVPERDAAQDVAATTIHPAPNGAFAALLVEWKRSHDHPIDEDLATPKSA